MARPELRRYQAELFVIAIKTKKQYSKVFQVIFHSEGLHGFKPVEKRDNWTPSIKKTGLPIEIGGSEPDAIKLVGRWYSPKSLFDRAGGQSRGPVVTGQTTKGHQVQGYLIAPPSGSPLEHYTLVLSYEVIPIINKNSDIDLTFIGGFDPPHILNNQEVDTTFLMLSYPVSSYEDMKMKLGSIDLR